ncbi:recombinase family protein [Nonomuraea insulae]|uniref:Recombinase family protein n=1 Tax=Nonomuraea insulae TaxID=1616787 RepID=A0ABW1D524_9ACTN
MNGARVGYARCSTDEQDVIIQTEQLLALGVPEDRIYIDRGFSGTTRRNRNGLDQALAAVWDGTVFTVTKFDRFARNMAEANDILTDLSDRGVLFGLSASVYDWNDPFGRLFLQTLAMVADSKQTSGTSAPARAWRWPREGASSRASSPSCPNPHGVPSAAATPKARSPWPTWPLNTASAGPPSTASSTELEKPPVRKRIYAHLATRRSHRNSRPPWAGSSEWGL